MNIDICAQELNNVEHDSNALLNIIPNLASSI